MLILCYRGHMKSTLRLIAIAAMLTAAFAQEKPQSPDSEYLEGIFSMRESGHLDWADHTKCKQQNGEWHCSGDWEAPTDITRLCLLRTQEQAEAILNCEDTSGLGLYTKVKYRLAQKEHTAYIRDKEGKEWKVGILHIRKEDPGVRKARIEMCQKGTIQGDRCADVAAPATDGAK